MNACNYCTYILRLFHCFVSVTTPFFLVACGGGIGKIQEGYLANDKISVENHNITVLTSDSLKVDINYTGDLNSNATAKFFYCNNTDTPGCDAKTGVSLNLIRTSSSTFSGLISNLSSPNDPEDSFNYIIVITDIDKDSPTRFTGSFQLLSEEGLSISNLTISNITNNSFDVMGDFFGDFNENGSAVLYYCNNTDTPGCDPSSVGTSVNMIKGASKFSASITSLSSPYDEADVLNIELIAQDPDGTMGSPLSSTVTLKTYSLSLSNLLISNVTNNSFDVSVDFNGDENTNGNTTLYYCNSTDAPACDPVSTGVSVAMTKGASSYTASISSLSSPNDEGDTFNIRVVASDTDGSSGSPQSTTTTLSIYSLSISNLAASNITSSAFDASVDFTGDMNTNGSVKLYYCNASQVPGCDPSAGASSAMTRGSSSYTVTISGLTSPTDVFNIRVVATDTNGTSNSPISSTVTLDGTALDLDGLTFSAQTKTGFTATVPSRGDSEQNGSVTLYYCNVTDSPSCDPTTTGTSVAMNRSGTTFTATVSGLTAPNDEADLMSVAAVASDPNGSIDSPKTGTVPLAQVVLSPIELVRATGTSFEISVPSSGDPETNSAATVWYCNETDSPGCNPEAGSSAAMTLTGANYVASVTGLTTPNDPNDYLNLRVIVTDPEGVYQSPQNATIRLTDIQLNGIVVHKLDTDSFSIDAQYTGDSDLDGSVTLYYCNDTDNPGCDPQTGNSVVMTRSFKAFTADITTLPVGYNPGDTIKVRTIAADPDTADPDPLNSSFPLPNPVHIYRSVGYGSTSALAVGGANAMSISASTAVFSSPLPDNVGVGDAIQYDSDGGGNGSGANTVDAIAFIHSRVSSTQFVVKNSLGGTPVATTSDTDWSIYRSYTSLADAENQIENTGIDLALRSFDGSGDRDISVLTGTDEVWHLALYNDAVFSEGVNFNTGWKTTLANHIHLFTPSSANQVGVSQRHAGAWSTSAVRIVTTDTTPIVMSANNSIIEGLQIYVQSPGNSSADGIYVNSSDNYYSQHYIKNNLFIFSGSAGQGNNGISIVGCGECFSINNIIAGYSSAIFYRVSGGFMRIYNTTTIRSLYGFNHEDGNMILKNSLALQCNVNSCKKTLQLHADSDYNITDVVMPTNFGANSFLTSQTTSELFVNFSDDGDFTNDDLRIQGSSSDQVGAGTDLSGDANFPFSTDIEGATRSVPWDVGADEL